MIFICSMFGVVIVSIVVVTAMNFFEMDNLELKVYTIINKISKKNKMKVHAAQIISKMTKLYLNVKGDKEVQVSDIYDLNNILQSFKEDRR